VAIQFTLPALIDLDEIESWYSQNYPKGLRTFRTGLDETFQTLDLFPQMGRARDDLRVGIRQINYRQYLIFYREFEEGVLVEAIVNGHRNIDDLFEP
jgi:toxin ParE1/3/4